MSLPIDQWMALQRRKRLAAVVVAVVVIGWTAIRVVDQWTQRIADDRRPRGHVVGVAGPSTLLVQLDGEQVEAMLAGLAVPAAWTAASRCWLDEQCRTQGVMLVRPRRDTVIRTDLGWLVYTDSGLFVNEAMIDQGYAIANEPDHDLSPWFTQLAEWARRKRRGEWADTLNP